MRKKYLLLLVLVLLLLSACGTGENKTTQGKKDGINIYYVNIEETKLVPVSYQLKATSPSKQVKELVKKLTKKTSSSERQNAVADPVKLVSCKLENRQLFVSFSGEYENLKPAREVLLRAAVVRTLLQVDGVDCISFYVEDTPLLDANGNLVGVMTEDSFAENLGKQINNIEAKDITLYFANKEGTGLVAEKQTVYGSSNSSMEKLVMQHLLKGPKSGKLQDVIPEGTKLFSVSTLNGVCFVNLDSGFTKQNYEIAEPVVIYGIVNSLTELSNVNKVQISVNGDTNLTYRTDYQLDTLYERNLDLVVTKEKEKSEKTGD